MAEQKIYTAKEGATRYIVIENIDKEMDKKIEKLFSSVAEDLVSILAPEEKENHVSEAKKAVEKQQDNASEYAEAGQKITEELNKDNSKSLAEMVEAQADTGSFEDYSFEGIKARSLNTEAEVKAFLKEALSVESETGGVSKKGLLYAFAPAQRESAEKLSEEKAAEIWEKQNMFSKVAKFCGYTTHDWV